MPGITTRYLDRHPFGPPGSPLPRPAQGALLRCLLAALTCTLAVACARAGSDEEPGTEQGGTTMDGSGLPSPTMETGTDGGGLTPEPNPVPDGGTTPAVVCIGEEMNVHNCDAPLEITLDDSQRFNDVVVTLGRGCTGLNPTECGGLAVGREQVLRLTMPTDGDLNVSVTAGGVDNNLGAAWDASTYMTTVCGDPLSLAAGCTAIPAGTIMDSTARFSAGQDVFIYLDGQGADSSGAARIEITLTP